MRGGRQKQGYTIVEVMIFLAISGFMFIIAGNFIAGKQARSEFRQGMNELNSEIRTVINDVSNGFYPSRSDFRCEALGTNPPTFPNSGTNEQGTNQGCTFMGKVVQFGVNGAPAGTYNVYTVVGRQFRADTGASAALIPPSTFAEAKPIAATGSGQNLTQVGSLKWGLDLYRMTDGSTNIGAVGFFSGFSSTDTDNNLESGAAAPMAIAIPGSGLNQDASMTEGQIVDLANPSTTINPNPNIVLCFRGGANQFGRLTIGSSNNVQGQKLATHIQITANTAPAGCT